MPYAHPAGGAGHALDPLDPTRTAHPVPGTPVPDPAARRAAPEVDDPGLGAEAFGTLSFLAGVWLVIAPFALDRLDGAAAGNNTAVGVAVAVVALARMAAPTRTAALAVVDVLLGGWLIVAPLVLDLPVVAAANDVVVGVLLVLFAVAGAVLGRRARRQLDRRTGRERPGRRRR